MQAEPLRATLIELGLHSKDPAALAAFYEKAMGFRFEDRGGALLGTARDRRLAILEGAPKSLAYAAYAVAGQSDLDALAVRLDGAGTPFTRSAILPFKGEAISVLDPDGNEFRFGVRTAEEYVPRGDVGDMPARVQHVVFATTDIGRMLGFFTNVLGFVLSDRVVDGEGELRTAFVRCSAEHHSLAVFAAGECRLDHHCYEAVEWNMIRDWADHFASHRIGLKWGPGRHGPGDNLFLFIHDTDGNWAEISAELEQVASDKPAGEWPHEEHTLNSWGIGLLRS